MPKQAMLWIQWLMDLSGQGGAAYVPKPDKGGPRFGTPVPIRGRLFLYERSASASDCS
ncbi:hypothetical protein GCM10007972_21830 [Iodidimonas muriae]|uniref:Uncharacterized protein n=1 Tax=Iodidimonas muriae TaxID=261467 RepID=A0ABQ2LFA3_9PROT|nr:hypothetical protein JCM17843_19610 [Kordiimonadales bacterium JCM 17843]GGO14539.1 hypothetical protein GCM10007972_21830 [Iodidimonas muriae]